MPRPMPCFKPPISAHQLQPHACPSLLPLGPLLSRFSHARAGTALPRPCIPQRNNGECSQPDTSAQDNGRAIDELASLDAEDLNTAVALLLQRCRSGSCRFLIGFQTFRTLGKGAL